MVFWPQMGLSISLPPPSIPPLNTHLLSESKRRAIFAWIWFETTSFCCSCPCECSLFSTFDSHSCSNGENRMKLLWEEGSMRGPRGTWISTGFVRRRIMIGLILGPLFFSLVQMEWKGLSDFSFAHLLCYFPVALNYFQAIGQVWMILLF